MELRHLRYFVAAAEELRFSRAAERLGISQPSLSQQVQTLEKEIGARLFECTSHRVGLTDTGRLLLDESRQMLAQVGKVVLLARRARLGELDELKIGFTSSAPFTLTVPNSIHASHKAYPGIHLSLQGMGSRRMLKALLEGNLRVGVIHPLALPDAVHQVELFREPLVVVLQVDHPLATGSEDGLAIAALAKEPFVFFPRSYGTRLYDQVIAPTRQAGFSPRIIQEANKVVTIIDLVSAGLGMLVLPASFRHTQVDGVVYRTLSDPEATTAVWLVRRQNEGSPLTLSFIDLMIRETANLRRR